MIAETELEPELLYDLKVLPPGRVPFRRVRWELWQGQRLLATGWRTSQPHAERALRTAASRVAHRILGLVPLRPQDSAFADAFRPGDSVRLDCGAVTCRLVHRRAIES